MKKFWATICEGESEKFFDPQSVFLLHTSASPSPPWDPPNERWHPGTQLSFGCRRSCKPNQSSPCCTDRPPEQPKNIFWVYKVYTGCRKIYRSKYLRSLHKKAHTGEGDRPGGVVDQADHPSATFPNTFRKLRLFPDHPLFSLFFLSILLFLTNTSTDTNTNTNSNTDSDTQIQCYKKHKYLLPLLLLPLLLLFPPFPLKLPLLLLLTWHDIDIVHLKWKQKMKTSEIVSVYKTWQLTHAISFRTTPPSWFVGLLILLM